MDPLNGLQPQFLTRKMLDFEHAVSFGLKIWSQCTSDNVIQIRVLLRGPFQFTHTTDSSADTKTKHSDCRIFRFLYRHTANLTRLDMVASLLGAYDKR